MTKRILIIGATSAIAQNIAKIYAAQHADLYLVARNFSHLETIATDLKIRGAARVGQSILDMKDLTQKTDSYMVAANLATLNNQSADSVEQHKYGKELSQQEIMLTTAKTFLGGFDVVLIAHGSLSDQAACEKNYEETLTEFNTNALSVIALLTLLANELLAQGSGTIAVISSVAGDRGRQNNYVYGAAKAMVSTFLQGLRARLYKSNIHVLTIKPGFVDTPMTAHLTKNFLFASPENVAKDIVNAINKKKDILYTPWFWRIIMMIIKPLPEKIAKRLSF
jgi:hypothetical protein